MEDCPKTCRGGHVIHTKLRVKLIEASWSTTGNEGAEARVYCRRQWSLSECQRWLQEHDQWPEDLSCLQRPADPVTPVNPVKYLWDPTDMSTLHLSAHKMQRLHSPLSASQCHEPGGLPATPMLVSANHLMNILKVFFRLASEYHQFHYLKYPCHRFLTKLLYFY